MRKLVLRSLVLFFTISTLTSFLSHSSPKEISKEELQLLYKNYYLSSRIDCVIWKSAGKCDPGAISAEIYKKAENRINFFRLVNRLPLIKIVDDKKAEAQAAAFLMYQNNSLSHVPPTTWKCYSEKGKEGAASSCLGIFNFRSLKETTFITDYIRDGGEMNNFVGHRRWILSSQAKKFSYGATKKTDALYCMPELTQDTLKTNFIAYPWNGCIPHNLVFPKWSFAIPAIHKVDFSKAKLVIKDQNGAEMPYKVLDYNDAYPDHVIVWKMPSLFTDEEETKFKNNLVEKGFIDKIITVRFENVMVNDKLKTYEYKVKIVRL